MYTILISENINRARGLALPRVLRFHQRIQAAQHAFEIALLQGLGQHESPVAIEIGGKLRIVVVGAMIISMSLVLIFIAQPLRSEEAWS